MMVSYGPPIPKPGNRNRVIGQWSLHDVMPRRHAFSLIELLVVIAVVTLLTALMMPALSQVRENARRVVCASNLHNMGVGLQAYYDDHDSKYPYSVYGDPGSGALYSPQEMMAVHRGHESTAWDGLGLLFIGNYCNAPQCFYCPSHTGDHEFERYENDYYWPGNHPIYGNYQYAGHLDWHTKSLRRAGLRNGHEPILVTDGMRTARDFNHRNGANVLRADGAVRWFDDSSGSVLAQLPTSPNIPASVADPLYIGIWASLENPAATASASHNPNH